MLQGEGGEVVYDACPWGANSSPIDLSLVSRVTRPIFFLDDSIPQSLAVVFTAHGYLLWYYAYLSAIDHQTAVRPGVAVSSGLRLPTRFTQLGFHGDPTTIQHFKKLPSCVS